MSKQLAQGCYQWNSGATRELNRGHRVQIPSALTTKPLNDTSISTSVFDSVDLFSSLMLVFHC